MRVLLFLTSEMEFSPRGDNCNGKIRRTNGLISAENDTTWGKKSQPSKIAVTTHYFRNISRLSRYSAMHNLLWKSQCFNKWWLMDKHTNTTVKNLQLPLEQQVSIFDFSRSDEGNILYFFQVIPIGTLSMETFTQRRRVCWFAFFPSLFWFVPFFSLRKLWSNKNM